MTARNRVRGLARLLPEWAWDSSKRRQIATFNPNRASKREHVTITCYTIFDYDAEKYTEQKAANEQDCHIYKHSGHVTWINVDGLKKEEVERLCSYYGIHPLIVEDILSEGQRAKMDETGDLIYCLMPMLYYNNDTGEIETEQVSIILGKEFVISFQEDPKRDVFDTVREKIRTGYAQLRERDADYLCYCLVDSIVDSYFGIIDKLNDRVEKLEDSLLLQKERGALEKISILRREVMLLRRSITPVREVVIGFIASENRLLEGRHDKYYKDVRDHITLGIDYAENLRDMLMNLQDLSMSQINLRMNEVMKVFTLLATLMAPATVIGGIFGMNFDVIPLAHHREGFYVTVGIMLFVPLLMMVYFKRKGWF